MSPKKRQRRKPDHDKDTQDQQPRQDEQAPGSTEDQTEPGTRTISRTPVVIKDPPDRRITGLWVTMTILWALGTPVAVAYLLFIFLNMQDQMMNMQDPTGAPPQDMLSSLGTALLWVLILGLLVPLASAVTALILRRKIAAIGFTAALALTALPLFLLMPPTELWQALTAHLGS